MSKFKGRRRRTERNGPRSRTRPTADKIQNGKMEAKKKKLRRWANFFGAIFFLASRAKSRFSPPPHLPTLSTSFALLCLAHTTPHVLSCRPFFPPLRLGPRRPSRGSFRFVLFLFVCWLDYLMLCGSIPLFFQRHGFVLSAVPWCVFCFSVRIPAVPSSSSSLW